MTAARLEEGAEHVRKGRWAKAIEVYRAVLADEPDNIDLRVALADVYKRAKNVERAFHHYHRASALLIGKGEYVRAAMALSEANVLQPNTPDVLWRLCESYKALGRIDEAVQHLVALIRAAPAPGDRRRLWALEELFMLHPDDLSVGQQRAEALFEADRIDESVGAYKRLAARLGQRENELVQVLARAAKIAEGRPELGADIAGVLIAHGLAKDALAVIVGFYEKAPDDVAVLETLLRALEAIGAKDKAIAARVELLKARAATGASRPVVADVEALLSVAPDDPMALEVAAHALVLVREFTRAQDTWRRLMRTADKRGLRDVRDRAVHQVLKTNPDDEEALELAAVAHAAASRFHEADMIRKRLVAVRALKRRSLLPQPALRRSSTPSPSMGSTAADELGTPEAGSLEPASEDLMPTGTMVLSDSDVVDVRGHAAHRPAREKSAVDAIVPASNPWFAGSEERPADLSLDEAWYDDDRASDPSTLSSEATRERGVTTSGRTPLPRHDTATDDHEPDDMLESSETRCPGEEPTTMDTRVVGQLRGLTQAAVVYVEDAPSLPGELTQAGPTVRSGVIVPTTEDLVDEP